MPCLLMRGRIGVGVFLHELAHTYLHFPEGPNITLEDPWNEAGNPLASEWEAEASAVAHIVQMVCEGEPDASHNRLFLDTWEGEEEDMVNLKDRVMGTVQKIVAHYEGRFTGEDLNS